MPNSHPFVQRVNELLKTLDSDPSAKNGVELANEILKLVGMLGVKSAEEVFESSLELPNAERYDRWFQPHPIFKSDRACFELAESELLQAKFYWLNKHSRQVIAGGVHFTPNFEDEEFTHNDRYKVGLDFFLSSNGKSLQVVLSNRGNLRVVELNKRLNITQIEIFTKWDGAGSLSTQEALHTTLWESFKLKSVNQKFYDGVANSFNELLQHLKSIDKDDEEAKLFASRLLGRLLFCWFLRKKGIIDEGIGYFNAKGTDATTYYKLNLERLFFLTLNTPIVERDELQKQHQQQLVHLPAEDKQPSLFKTDQKTPYLNGGLFEPHENDWFGDDSLTLPEGFFANIYDHFDEFNFTTDESSPEYEQIAIDPEMLGRVFESLLATQLDETGQQARKAKGAFYTPREIVGYMCKESLRYYLYNSIPQDERYKKAIDDLLDTSDREWAGAGTNSKRDSVPKEYRVQIIEALDVVTILDPACGSGAFPMGMLQLCLRTYERLESRFDPYKTKLDIIQNNIFGVDIEPMAVEIARLRAWLSLIVDEEDGRDVEPLPNLDFKFLCANSLIPLDKEIGLFSDSSLHQKLKDIRTKYFNARKPHTKKALQDEYYKLTSAEQIALIGDDNRTKQLKSFDPFKNSIPASFFDTDQMFGLDDGFKIVIGNPPYIQLQKNGGVLADQFKHLNYETFSRSGDIYTLFFEQGLNFLSKGSYLCYITSNKWMRTSYGLKLREYFLKQNPVKLIDFAGFQVFDTAAVDTTIVLVQKGENANNLQAVHFKNDYKSGDDIGGYFKNNTNLLSNLTPGTWFIGDKVAIDLKNKIEEKGLKLSNWDDLAINYGIKTGANDVFIVDQNFKDNIVRKEPESSECIKPLLRGLHTNRYKVDWSNDYILYIPWHFPLSESNLKGSSQKAEQAFSNDHPLLYEYFVKNKDRLLQRNKAETGIRYEWYALQRSGSSYMNDFSKPKVVWMNMNRGWKFAYSEAGYYVDMTLNFLASDKYSKVMTGILSSNVHKWYFLQTGRIFDNGGFMTKVDSVSNFPVPKKIDENKELFEEIESIVDIIIDTELSDDLEDRVNKLVYKLYDLNPEEVAIIEQSVK